MSMPAIIYNLLREVIDKHRRGITLTELINHVMKKSPHMTDTVLQSVLFLEEKGLVKREYNKEFGNYIWSLTDLEITPEEMLRDYPELFEQSLLATETFGKPKKKTPKERKNY